MSLNKFEVQGSGDIATPSATTIPAGGATTFTFTNSKAKSSIVISNNSSTDVKVRVIDTASATQWNFIVRALTDQPLTVGCYKLSIFNPSGSAIQVNSGGTVELTVTGWE